MVNTLARSRPDRLAPATALLGVYVAVVAATLVALGLLQAVQSPAATDDAWVHAIIIAVFAVLLPLRLRAARRGSGRAVRAVAVIAGVLAVVNVVEALISALFPAWMRIEMVGIALLMVVLGIVALRAIRS